MKTDLPLGKFIDETLKIMDCYGLLLASKGTEGRQNVMTIGWGFIGYLWEKPYFIVAVRPSRYTHELIEEGGDFTVNVPSIDMEETVEYCGTVSGRDHDKFKERGLKAVKGRHVNSPIIQQCPLHFECRVEYSSELQKEKLSAQIIEVNYPSGDFHTLYFGEILSFYGDEGAEERLMKI